SAGHPGLGWAEHGGQAKTWSRGCQASKKHSERQNGSRVRPEIQQNV
ncbi:hypothetical protein FOFC_09733, partial [Fusarium oxysporum]